MTALTERGILDIIRHPEGLPWTIQGFGMLRLYLAEDEVWRLHIWDTEEMAVEDVDRTHDHPWDFTSRIASGTIRNQRFEYGVEYQPNATEWKRLLIKTGEGAFGIGEPEPAWLVPEELESYSPGGIYHQDAPEVHESIPSRGCVTLVERQFTRPRDRASVFYRHEGTWVDATVRPATPEEVRHFTQLALERWDS